MGNNSISHDRTEMRCFGNRVVVGSRSFNRYGRGYRSETSFPKVPYESFNQNMFVISQVSTSNELEIGPNLVSAAKWEGLSLMIVEEVVNKFNSFQKEVGYCESPYDAQRIREIEKKFCKIFLLSMVTLCIPLCFMKSEDKEFVTEFLRRKELLAGLSRKYLIENEEKLKQQGFRIVIPIEYPQWIEVYLLPPQEITRHTFEISQYQQSQN